MWSAGVQRQIPYNFIVDVTYVGRRGLYNVRERDINQLLPGTVQANPGVNVAALRPYKGYGVIRLSENAAGSMYNSLQISADRRYTNGFKFGVAYTLGKSEDDASGLRDVLFNNYDASGFWGNSGFDRRHALNFYYIYDLPFYRDPAGSSGRCWADGRSRARRSCGRARRSGSPKERTLPALAIRSGIPGISTATLRATRTRSFRRAQGPIRTSGSIRRSSRGRRAGTFGNGPRNNIYNPGQYQWDVALFKNVNLGGTKTAQFRAEIFNFINHANWTARTEPDERDVRPCHRKADDRRDIQLAFDSCSEPQDTSYRHDRPSPDGATSVRRFSLSPLADLVTRHLRLRLAAPEVACEMSRKWPDGCAMFALARIRPRGGPSALSKKTRDRAQERSASGAVGQTLR